MKEIWGYLGYSFGFGGAPRAKAAPPEILRAKTPVAYTVAVSRLFDSVPLTCGDVTPHTH